LTLNLTLIVAAQKIKDTKKTLANQGLSTNGNAKEGPQSTVQP
jgi:hypothetical protein